MPQIGLGCCKMLCHIERNFFVFDLSSKCFMYLIVIIILIRMLKFMLNLYWKIIFTPFLRLSLTLFWLGGEFAPPPSRYFLNNFARKNFIATKLLDILQLLIVQHLKKFH